MDNIAFEDYYEDLQVSYNADLETIERVYRLLAKRYHPDNSQTGNTDRFEIITKAYKIGLYLFMLKLIHQNLQAFWAKLKPGSKTNATGLRINLENILNRHKKGIP